MSKESRLEKESVYKYDNNRALSACCGYFYIKNRRENEYCKHREQCIKYKRFKDGETKSADVRFRYVDTFRECELYKDEVTKWDIIRTAIYNILYVNDLAISCIYEMKPYVETQDKETKKIFNALMKRVNGYKEMTNELGKKNVYVMALFQSFMDDRAFDKVEILKSKIRESIENKDIPNAKFIATTEVARTMVGYSVLSCKKRYEETIKYDKNAVSLLHYRQSDMLRVVENLSNWVGRHCKGLDLNTESILSAYRDLDKLLTNRYIINDSLEQAECYIQSEKKQ